MEKTICINMLQTKDIEVTSSDGKKLVVNRDNRVIKADKLFELLDYTYGDTYTIEVINEKKVDEEVVSFFSELLQDVVMKLNEIEIR